MAPTHDRTEKMHTVAYKDTTGSRVPSRQMMELMTIAMIAALYAARCSCLFVSQKWNPPDV